MDNVSAPFHFFDGEDKVIHFLMYLGLMVLLVLSWKKENFFLNNPVTISIVGIVLAVGTEMAQHYIPGRTTSFGDLIANLMGLVVGYFVAQRLIESRILKKSNR